MLSVTGAEDCRGCERKGWGVEPLGLSVKQHRFSPSARFLSRSNPMRIQPGHADLNARGRGLGAEHEARGQKLDRAHIVTLGEKGERTFRVIEAANQRGQKTGERGREREIMYFRCRGHDCGRISPASRSYQRRAANVATR